MQNKSPLRRKVGYNIARRTIGRLHELLDNLENQIIDAHNQVPKQRSLEIENAPTNVKKFMKSRSVPDKYLLADVGHLKERDDNKNTGREKSKRKLYSAKNLLRGNSFCQDIRLNFKVGSQRNTQDLARLEKDLCLKEESDVYGGCGRSGSKYHRPATSSDDVCTDDVTTPSDFNDKEERRTRSKTCRSFASKYSESKKPWQLSPKISYKDAACESSCSDMSPDCVNFKRSSPSHSEKHKFKRIEMNISSKRADSDSNLDSEPLELPRKRCPSSDEDKSRYVDEIGFVRERPGPSRGYKELIFSPTKKRAQNSYDYDYETDDEDYSKREEKGSQKYYRHYKASTSKTSPDRHGQNIPPWSEKSANAFSNNPQRKTQQSISHSTFNRYSSAESKAFSLPVKCSYDTECGTTHRWARTPATNPRASISTDEESSDVAGVAGRCSQDCKSQSAAIYNLNHLPRWSPQKESCPPRSNLEVENLDIYEKI